MVTGGVGIGVGANGGVVGGVVGRPGDDTGIDETKGRSVTAQASVPGSAAGGTVGATRDSKGNGDNRPIAEVSGGGGTGGASVTVNETVSVDDAIEAITSCFGWCKSEPPQPPEPK